MTEGRLVRMAGEEILKEILKEKLPRVWGVCNALLGDDAAGCKVAEFLLERGMEDVVDCGTTPENYVAALRRNPPPALLIVDAADMGLAPGECRRCSLGYWKFVVEASHGIPLPLLLAPFAESFPIAVLGIQPSTLGLGSPLSDAVEKTVCRVADLIARNKWRSVEGLREDTA